MKVLVFDTETTGLPSKKGYDNYYPYTELKYYDNSRIVSIAWNLYDDDELISSKYCIITPHDFKIDNNSIACKINGITDEISIKKGINIGDMFSKLHTDLYNTDIIVAHNLLFDEHILLAELYRNLRNDIISIYESKQYYCTMKYSTNLLKIPMKYGNFKSPKLIELYLYLFGEKFDNEHNALADVEACAKCYFQLKHSKIYTC